MRYFALRIIQWFFYLVALMWLAGGILACVQIANGQMTLPAFLGPKPVPGALSEAQGVGEGWAILFTIIGTLILVLLTVAVAQVIGVVLDIATNTRRAADALERGGR